MVEAIGTRGPISLCCVHGCVLSIDTAGCDVWFEGLSILGSPCMVEHLWALFLGHLCPLGCWKVSAVGLQQHTGSP